MVGDKKKSFGTKGRMVKSSILGKKYLIAWRYTKNHKSPLKNAFSLFIINLVIIWNRK